ncbi:hypothetical protein [Rickettsia endosymbiont of Culicoides newsteadi]|uniref:hypothetical protein n=1 Tax=Rickettsia endosymbiont of Culicoides newsteadi TaxID=1961830 RepID=UPI000B9AC66F|nr:hypothetical protein [Rickettsia endosymbiont of Culicoides newsteadi]OZG31270.1 hypothetical protein RiCNE_13450 [Rickettsia endosymbiont of Culicoides newsteadi]
MAKKPLPTEIIVTLYHQLANLSAKHPDRNKLIKETAEIFSVSFSTVRRAIKNYSQPRSIKRADYNKPRKTSFEEMLRYCELRQFGIRDKKK